MPIEKIANPLYDCIAHPNFSVCAGPRILEALFLQQDYFAADNSMAESLVLRTLSDLHSRKETPRAVLVLKYRDRHPHGRGHGTRTQLRAS